MGQVFKGLLHDQAYFDGQWQLAASGERFPVINPATGETLAEVVDCGPREVEAAVAAAKRAFPAWRDLTAKERSKRLRRWYDLIMDHQDTLARLMTAEQGKPLAEARGEVAYGANFIEWFAEEAKRLYGDVIPSHKANGRIVTLKQPIGVVAAVTPWNFPIAMITRKVAPALAAGCTAVVKPAQATPLSALALAYLARQADIPPGVFNVVPGQDAKAIGDVLTGSPDVAKFSFTGSTAVGKQLMAQCADTVKKVSLELGGNAPFLVFDDADLDAAVEGAIASKYRNAGQTCICANRILVQSGVYDAFAERLAEKVRGLTVGPGDQDKVKIGPLITDGAVDKVEELVGDARHRGAQVMVGGQRHALGGRFYAPTVLTQVPREAAMFDEEIFGPVAPLYRFEDEADAIAQANATRYGLASYFYARDIGRIWRVMEGLEYGMVGVNTGMISTEVAPFGGVKESGIGREGSKYGLEEFVEIKYALLGGLDQ